MRRDAIVLYGPPASGKDAVTQALSSISPRCVLFEKLKAGTGRAAGYRPTTPERIDGLRDLGLNLYVNERYGNVYAVDRPELDALLDRGLIPVVHMGQLTGVRALKTYSAAWLSVLLWCPREVTEARLRQRETTDSAARLAAWDDTVRDLERMDPSDFDLRIRTDRLTPAEAAEAIRARLEAAASAAQPAQAP